MLRYPHVPLALALALALALGLGETMGLAQPQGDVDRARALAREAADLLDGSRYEAALDRATRAEALYHAPLHLEIIAESLEGLGRLAEAATTYEKLVAEPLPPSAPRVFQEAQDKGKLRLRQLLARVPSLLVRVPDDTGDARATIDGKPVDLRSGTARRFDPGDHTIEVTRPGFEPFAKTVTLPERGGVVVVEATLEQVAADRAPAPASAPASSPPPATAPPPPDTGPRRASPAPALIAFAVGAAGLATGAITGIVYLGRLGDLKDRCPSNRCTPAEQPEIDATGRLGTISTVAFGLGVAGVAAGAILLVVRPRGTPSGRPAARQPATPWIGAGSAGILGRF